MHPFFITISLITNVLCFQLALSGDEKERGLMYRKSWGEIDGMLFLNEEPQRVSYWMKNTCLNLTMCFLDRELQIREVICPEPFSTELITSSNTNISYVLELNPELTNLVFSHYSAFQKKVKNQIKRLK